MDRGCFLAAQDERMIGEDYQVFLSDGRAFGQVLVLGCSDPTAGGKQGGQSHLKFNSQLQKHVTAQGLNFGLLLK